MLYKLRSLLNKSKKILSKSKYLNISVLLLLIILIVMCSSDKKEDAIPLNFQPKSILSMLSGESFYGDALATASISDPINLIPAISSDSASHDVASYIYNGLVKYDKNLNLVGDLAKSWKISDDNLNITFYLRDDVVWHDNRSFTAKDVEFTYRFMIDNGTPTSYDSDFRLINSVEIIDNYTVSIRYNEPFSPALSSWGIWIMPAHLLDGVSPIKSPLQRHPIGTGPYKMLEWLPGRSLQLIANKDYFESEPYLERIIFRVIPDSATLFLELLNGSVDTMSLSAMQAAKQTDKERFKNKFNIYSYLDNSYTYIGYNLRRAPFDDLLVRRALSYAIPKQDIINGLIFNKGVEATGPYKVNTQWHNPDVEKYPYNPTKAKELLKEAGFIDTDGDGYLERDGKPFKFEITTNQGNTTRIQIAEVVQRAYKDIGINAEVRVVEWATFINEYINKSRFSVIIMGWNIIQDPDLFDVWHSSKCDENGLNFICYKNDEVDALLEQGRRTYDIDERKKAYFKMQELIALDAPYTFLYIPYANIALDKRFENINPAPAGLKHNLIEWYVKKSNQKYNFYK